jgi:hypothetical protein
MLTIVPMEMCESINGPKNACVGGYRQHSLFHERLWPRCSCPAYKFRRNGSTNFGGENVAVKCKHIEEAEEVVCGWHELYGESQEEPGRCPRCGGPTVVFPLQFKT